MDVKQQLNELKEARRWVSELNRLATLMRRNNRFAIADPDCIVNAVEYYGVQKTQEICCLGKTAFWYYRKHGIFPQPDLEIWANSPLWCSSTIRLWMIERIQNGYPIKKYGHQFSEAHREKMKEVRQTALFGSTAPKHLVET